MFAFGGAEIIGITAGEAEGPARTIPRAVNTVPVRIMLFYVATLAVIMAINPWHTIGTEGSPFVQIFEGIGIGPAATVLNVVVIIAALSAINSDIFGAGRMMYGMAQRGQAPAVMSKVTRGGVPWMTVTVMILLSQYRARRRMSPQEAAALKFPVPLWPYAQLAALAFLGFVIVVLAFDADSRLALVVGAVWPAGLALAYLRIVRPRTAEPVAGFEPAPGAVESR